MSDRPLVSLIIPVRNDSIRLGRCLEALTEQEDGTPEFEIIVVDNASHDSPGDVAARFPRTVLAYEPLPACSRARNHGIRLARGEILGFTDADCIPRTDWVRRGVERLHRSPATGLVAGRIDVFVPGPAAPTLAEWHDLVLAFAQERCVRRSHYGATANVFTRREVVQEVGFLRDDLVSGEDAEWGLRVHRSGRKVIYAEEVRVAHPARHTIAEQVARTRLGAAGLVTWRRGRPWALLRDQLKDLVPPPDLIWKIASSPRVPRVSTRLGILLLFLGLRQVRFWERWRILLGGTPVQ